MCLLLHLICKYYCFAHKILTRSHQHDCMLLLLILFTTGMELKKVRLANEGQGSHRLNHARSAFYPVAVVLKIIVL